MTARKPLIRYSGGAGLQEVQLASGDLSDGPFLTDAPSDGTTYGRKNGAWTGVTGGSGSITAMTVVSANGFTGAVANPATTPAITIGTTVAAGMVKSNGSGLTGATAGIDYVYPPALAGTTGATLVGVLGPINGETPLTQYQWDLLGALVPQRFGAVGDGVTDDSTAFTNLFATGLPWYIPSTANGYLISQTQVITSGGRCDGKIIVKAGFAGVALLICNSVYGRKLAIYGLDVYSTDVRPNPYTGAKTVGIQVGPTAAFLGNTSCQGVILYNCRSTRFSINLHINTYDVTVIQGDYAQGDHCILVYAYDTTYNQVNDVSLTDVDANSAVTSYGMAAYGLRVGTEGNGVYNTSISQGVNLRVTGCDFTGSLVYIDNIYGVNYQSNYHEQGVASLTQHAAFTATCSGTVVTINSVQSGFVGFTGIALGDMIFNGSTNLGYITSLGTFNGISGTVNVSIGGTVSSATAMTTKAPICGLYLGSAGAATSQNINVFNCYFVQYYYAINAVYPVSNLRVGPNIYSAIQYSAVLVNVAENQNAIGFFYQNGYAQTSCPAWGTGPSEVQFGFSTVITSASNVYTTVTMSSDGLQNGSQLAPTQSATTNWYPRGMTSDGWQTLNSALGRNRSGSAAQSGIHGTQAGNLFTFSTLSQAQLFNGGDNISSSSGGASWVKSVNYTTGQAILDNTYTGSITITHANAYFVGFNLSGNGSPQGAVAANPGSRYINLSGGAGTTYYVKESGTGTNTGWVGK